MRKFDARARSRLGREGSLTMIPVIPWYFALTVIATSVAIGTAVWAVVS